MKQHNIARTAVLVDPHPLWIEAVERVLTAVPVEIVAKVPSLEEAQEPIERLRPDLVVAEIAIGSDKADGVAWLHRTVETFGVKAVVLTACPEPEYIEAALQAGASAVILKVAHPDDLAIAVRQAFEHSIYLPKKTSHGTQPAPALLDSHELTKREIEILHLVAEGHSNARLAKMLWVTEQTIKFHLSNVYRKLGVSNRTEASRWAQLHGLLPPRDTDQVA